MTNGDLLIIGASTGGPKILEELVPRLQLRSTAVLIIQHITPYIDKAFVTSLARKSAMPVSLGGHEDYLQKGHITVAPGGSHLVLCNNLRICLTREEPVNSVRPSIDVTMKSVVRTPHRLAGVILSGMGRDGAEGIIHLKKLGATTIAQDKHTSVIYGMPKAAAETDCIDFVLPTVRIADKVMEILS